MPRSGKEAKENFGAKLRFASGGYMRPGVIFYTGGPTFRFRNPPRRAAEGGRPYGGAPTVCRGHPLGGPPVQRVETYKTARRGRRALHPRLAGANTLEGMTRP